MRAQGLLLSKRAALILLPLLLTQCKCDKTHEDRLPALQPNKVASTTQDKKKAIKTDPGASGKLNVQPTELYGWESIMQYTNKFRFFKDGFKWIAERECGKCLKPCHDDEHDPGGTTCIGMAETFNKLFYLNMMNDMFNKCYETKNKDGVYVLTCIGMRHPIQLVKQRYYELYYRQYEMCPWDSSMIITDSAITSGQKTATKLLQRSAGLKVDGVFGPKSLNACKHFNKQAYMKAEIKRYKSLKQCARYCKGWIKRVRLKDKRF